MASEGRSASRYSRASARSIDRSPEPSPRAISSAVDVPVIASGGAGEPEHLVDGFDAGADAVLLASVLHYGRYTVTQLKDHLAGAGVPVRRVSST